MRKRLVISLACGLLASLMLSNVVRAAPMLVYDPSGTYVAGITNLSVDGTVYNVQFVQGSYLNIFAGAPPTFLNNPDVAFEAEGEIYGMLTSPSPDPQLVGPSRYFLLPYLHDDVSGVVTARYECYFGEWHRHEQCIPGGTYPFGILNIVMYSGMGVTTYAVFSPAPEPATLALLSLGLAGLGFSRRKQ